MQADSLPAEPQEKPKNTGVGSLSLLQWIFPTQESNQGLLHCRRILYQLSYQGSPVLMNITLFGNRFFADDQLKTRSLGWDLIQHNSVLQKGNLNTETDTHRRTQWEDEGKTGVMHPHAEKGQWLFTNHQELGRALEQNQPIEGTKPADTLSQTSGFQNCETINFFCGTLLQLP